MTESTEEPTKKPVPLATETAAKMLEEMRQRSLALHMQLRPILDASSLLEGQMSTVLATAKAVTDSYRKSVLPGLASQFSSLASIVNDLERSRERVIAMPSRNSNREEVRVNVDASLLQKIRDLEEENEELRRRITLLESKKKSDYIT
jgi:hypothetical protein